MFTGKFRYGALTGIPINYTFTSSSEIDRTNVLIRGNPVDWNSKGGKLLEESLILSEDEQIFGIAREILQLRNHNVLLNSIYACGSVVSFYITTSTINSKLKLFYRPLSMRIALYTIVGLFGFGIYAFFTDFTQVSKSLKHSILTLMRELFLGRH